MYLIYKVNITYSDCMFAFAWVRHLRIYTYLPDGIVIVKLAASPAPTLVEAITVN